MPVKSRFLVMNGAGAGKGQSNLVALVEENMQGEYRSQFSLSLAGRGASEQFAPSVWKLLSQAQWPAPPDAVIAVVGPGSFTGLRASLALASGLARGWNCPGIGVTLGQALRSSLALEVGRCPEQTGSPCDDVTVLCLARRGRIFVDEIRDNKPVIYALPIKEIGRGQWCSVAGDAVAGEDALPELTGDRGLLATGAARHIYTCPAPEACGIARAAGAGDKALPLAPLYIDPPEARLPASGLRPAPV